MAHTPTCTHPRSHAYHHIYAHPVVLSHTHIGLLTRPFLHTASPLQSHSTSKLPLSNTSIFYARVLSSTITRKLALTQTVLTHAHSYSQSKSHSHSNLHAKYYHICTHTLILTFIPILTHRLRDQCTYLHMFVCAYISLSQHVYVHMCVLPSVRLVRLHVWYMHV